MGQKRVYITDIPYLKGLKGMQDTVIGERKVVLIRGVSSLQGCPLRVHMHEHGGYVWV